MTHDSILSLFEASINWFTQVHVVSPIIDLFVSFFFFLLQSSKVNFSACIWNHCIVWKKKFKVNWIGWRRENVQLYCLWKREARRVRRAGNLSSARCKRYSRKFKQFESYFYFIYFDCWQWSLDYLYELPEKRIAAISRYMCKMLRRKQLNKILFTFSNWRRTDDLPYK